MTISTDDIDLAKKIIAFVDSLKPGQISVNTPVEALGHNYLPKIIPADPGADITNIFGLWEGRDELSAETLREKAWSRNSSYHK